MTDWGNSPPRAASRSRERIGQPALSRLVLHPHEVEQPVALLPEQRASGGIRKVVMRAGRVVDGIPPPASRPPLQAEEGLHAQLLGLERRTARGGRDSIDHAPDSHDDLANVAAGALLGHQGNGLFHLMRMKYEARQRGLPDPFP